MVGKTSRSGVFRDREDVGLKRLGLAALESVIPAS